MKLEDQIKHAIARHHIGDDACDYCEAIVESLRRLARVEAAALLDLAESYPSRCSGCVGGNAPDEPPDCPGHETATVERIRLALTPERTDG